MQALSKDIRIHVLTHSLLITHPMTTNESTNPTESYNRSPPIIPRTGGSDMKTKKQWNKLSKLMKKMYNQSSNNKLLHRLDEKLIFSKQFFAFSYLQSYEIPTRKTDDRPSKRQFIKDHSAKGGDIIPSKLVPGVVNE